MARLCNQITVHKCLFENQARKVKEAINDITKNDSLSTNDTQAINKLIEVYAVLADPIKENRENYHGDELSNF